MRTEILQEAEDELNRIDFIWADAIWVLAVAHGRRRPEYWLQRKKKVD